VQFVQCAEKPPTSSSPSAASAAADSQHVAKQPSWAGKGAYRLLVEVPPLGIGARQRDLMPADLKIDLAAQLKELGADAKADLGSLQVIRYNPKTGEPLPYEEGYLYGRGPDDCPFRWYDGAIPYDFPQILGSITRMGGELRRVNKLRGGYFYNALGYWNDGHLAWVHTQERQQPSHYGIYFDLLPKGQEPREAPPRGWLGDGMPRADREAKSTTGDDHVIVTLDDWDGDGLTDIIYGEQYGCLFVLPNRGTKNNPEFPHAQMILDAEGNPIDVGLHASPFVVDWDGDGVTDLLVGCYENHVIWYRNEGTNKQRKLVYKKYVQADGKDLVLPVKPVTGRSEAIFDEDYYPVLEWADWNGDGKRDLLAGGYITGRIFFFENTGRAPDGTPLLKFRGPVEADGKPLNVRDWAASPCVADFDGDGKPELITGGFPMTPESSKALRMLRYYKNTGDVARPALVEQPLPTEGEFPAGGLAVPKAADLDGDGLLDLIVGMRKDIYVFRNVGTKTAPKFAVNVKPVPATWGDATIPTRQFVDWNKDGWPDYVAGYDVHLNARKGNPYRFDEVVRVLPPGVNIAHSTGIGDDWFWPYLCDFDQDGNVDVLFGDWHGTIWFHKNNGGNAPEATPSFDTTGYRLKTTDGKEIKVGPIGVDPSKNFAALQGARTVFVPADFDQDGLLDLVVADTFGKIRYFRNAGTKKAPVFDPAVEVGDVKTRTHLDATDWDGDGRIDVIAGSVNHQVHLFLNKGNKGAAAQFDKDKLLDLPPVLEPGAVAVDMNRDGDTDLFLTSTQGSVLVERSFAEHGYAESRLIRAESREAKASGK
jgi:hypothetical protein